MPTVATVAYGPGPSRQGTLYLPDGSAPRPVLVLLHGGFWRARYDRTLMVPLALDLVTRGYAVWNLEYRRVGEPGGGWPGTFDDVAAGIDRLDAIGVNLDADLDLDLRRVVALGHSAGGQLALWAATRERPAVGLSAAVALAGVTDLRQAADLDLGPGAVTALLDGPPDRRPERYAEASPIERLPLGVRQLLVHGERDAVVPVDMSRRYIDSARALGDDVDLVVCPETGHFQVVDPGHPCWLAVVERLPGLTTA